MVRGFVLSGMVTLCGFSYAVADVEQGTVEISTAASIHVLAASGQTETLLNIPVRLGWFTSANVSVEAEFIATIVENNDAGLIASGLVVFHIPSSAQTKPFILIGYGMANSIHLAGVLAAGDRGETVGVVNLGAGFKSFLGEHVAFRVEYRYQRFDFSYQAINSHLFFTGVSLFL